MRSEGEALQLWGGIECTVNRVRDRYFDQLALSGHSARIDDLDAIASLGIKCLCYPVLWELTALRPDAPPDWTWADARLERLRQLGIAPIVGFVHHGSGPPYTSLVEPGFAAGLASFAEQFAARYPWVDAYTPVNEPLTTARFSALYGIWYPHARDDRSFVRALLNQCAAIAAAMRAIRRIVPRAQLVQTDDLGSVRSTPRIAYQAEFENERRWLTWDLLCGRVDSRHPLRAFLEHCGAAAHELDAFVREPCPPDVIGVNHYVTSNRFLHEQPELFPPSCRGGNGRDRYADVEAVRIPGHPAQRFKDLLHETWRRYGRAIAVTESHMGCTREEQLRWLHEIWCEASAARADGVDVRAVTAWALFGSFNWSSLVTEDSGYYEPGAFDVRGPSPRATALARLIRELTHGAPTDEVSAGAGWWHRNERFLQPVPDGAAEPDSGAVPPRAFRRGREILIVGAGTLGTALAAVCDRRGLPYRLCARAALDICSERSIAAALAGIRPWAVINAAGYVRVDEAEKDPARCYLENSEGPRLLARACARHALPFLTYSSDLVFDGLRAEPYAEQHDPNPLNVYGASKVRAERAVLSAHGQALVVRTSAFFGPWDEHNFVTKALQCLGSGDELAAIDDLTVSPTYVPHLADATLDLLIDRATGIWHLANRGALTWAELAFRCAELADVSTHKLRRVSAQSVALAARRPPNSALTSTRGLLLPPLEQALDAYVAATALRRTEPAPRVVAL